MTTNNNNRVPQLRFPGFTGEWVVKKLGDCFEIGNGRDYKHLSKGNIPVYGSGGYMCSVNDYLFDGDSACIGRKGTINNPTFLQGKFWTVDTLFYTYDFKNTFAYFVYLLFQNIDWMRHNEAGGVPSLSKGIIKNIKVLLPPSLAEQQKIADCLSSLDEEIAAEAQKADALKDHKKGLMQQLFPQPGQTTPQRRFPGFEGEWVVKKLGDVFTRITRKNNEDNRNVLTISAQYGLVSQTDFFNKSVAAADVTGYYLLERGDFAYNKSSSSGNPMGVIKPLKKYEKGVVSTLYICFNCNEPKSISFWEQYFNAGRLDSEIRTIAQEGARNHGLLNVPTSDFFTLKVLVPTLAEQQKIADCLSELDEMISAQQQKVEALKEHKKGLMQKLFPKIN